MGTENKRALISNQICIDYLQSLGLNVSDAHANQFINIAQSLNLNPLRKEIHAIKYGNNFNIIIGYEVFLKRAEMSQQLSGWKCWTEGEGNDLKACIEIKRKDWSDPFYHEVYLDEYNQNNTMWKSKPRTMLKKVCIAQSFRMAFPVELGGLPYVGEEIPMEKDVTPSQPKAITPRQQLHALLESKQADKKDFAGFYKITRESTPEHILKLVSDFDHYFNNYLEAKEEA